MSKNTAIYPERHGLSRRTRVKLTLLCAAGFLFLLSLFRFASNEYLKYVSRQAEKSYFISQAMHLRYRFDAFLDAYGYSDIQQLKLPENDHSKLYFTHGKNILYIMLSDLNGFVIIHSDRIQEGTRIKITNPVVNRADNSSVKINGVAQNVCNVTLPFVFAGSTQGVLRVGYSRKGVRPLLDIEIIIRKAIKYTYLVLVVFILLAVALIWLVSAFLEFRAKKINKEQHQANLRQLEIIGAGIVHEVKNALNGIKMNIQMLQEQFEKLPSDLQSSFAKKAERIQSEAARTSEMLSEFLMYAKPGRFEPKPTNLQALLEEIAQSFEPECKKRNIILTCESKHGITSVNIDGKQLRHGVTNLIWNAIEAVGSNGKISLRGEIYKNNIIISVEDTGGGMSADAEKKSFDVFYSTKPQGAGLGLSIVRKVAAAHGGKVSLDNSPGNGCNFSIILPIN